MVAPRASIGIISIGDMGSGVARILLSQNYRVLSNIVGRSPSTFQRAAALKSLVLVNTDTELVSQSDFIISIVPPKDAIATAKRVATAWNPTEERKKKLVYLDLNAVAPSTARSVFAELTSVTKADGDIGLVDGGIIGGPPKPPKEGNVEDFTTWYRPSIVLSGPDVAELVPEHLFSVLRGSVVSKDLGAASGLKCCFASLSKGFIALAIQSWTTAARLGVLDSLRDNLKEFNPSAESRAAKGLTGLAPKAGRWIREMEEIGRTFREDGGWEGAREGIEGGSVFGEIAEIYKYISDDTVLGQEKIEARSRGTTAEDFVAAVLESREKK